MIKTCGGLNRVAVEVHGSKLFSAKHGFCAENKQSKIRLAPSKCGGRGTELKKFNIFKKLEEKTRIIFLIFEKVFEENYFSTLPPKLKFLELGK